MTESERNAYIDKTAEYKLMGYSEKEAKEKAMADYHAAASTPPAQEDEPVAVVRTIEGGECSYYYAEMTTEGYMLPHGTKLYTHPEDNKLRKAAEELIEYCSGPLKPELGRMIALTENLRAALEGK